LRRMKNRESLIEFIRDQEADDSFEYLSMSHLKMSALYWSLCSLYILFENDADLVFKHSPLTKSEIIDFVKSCRNTDGGYGGNIGLDSHLLFTLSAIQILNLIKENPENVEEIVGYILKMQNSDGSFNGDKYGETDTRFSYCALISLHLLNRQAELASMISKAMEYIEKCRNWDGGFGAVPGSESHSGNIFCCQALLKLFGSEGSNGDSKLIDWLSWRQNKSGGLNGRPQKLEDVCYSWWVLSSLANLGSLEFVDKEALERFITDSQEEIEGPIADRPGDMGDIFHTFFGIAGLSLLNASKHHLSPVDPIVCLPLKD
jgi:geranylgeranyl transferase type-2 subunit beta